MSRTEGLTSQAANGNRAPRSRRGASFRAKTERCEEDCGVNGDLNHSAMMTLESPPCRGLPGGYPTPLNVFCMPCPPSSLPPPGILSFSPSQHDMGLPPSLHLSHPSPGSDHGGKLSPGQSEDFLCRWQDCQRVFDHLDDLVNHVNDHHIKLERPDVDYQCRWTDCPRQGRGFNARYKMLIHVRTHTNEKPHRCALCGKSFSRLENLKIHHRSHTGEKPYVCPVEGCGKAYSNSSDRFKHVRTHQEEKPYICRAPGCLKRYTDPSSLRKHIRTHNHHFRSSGEHGSITSSNGTATTNGVPPRSRGSNSHSQSPPLQYSSQSSPPAHAHRLSPSTPSLQHSPAHGLMSPMPPQMLPVQDGMGVGMLSDSGPLHGSLFTSAIITSSPHVTSSTMATELLPTMLPHGSVAAHSSMPGGLVMLDVKQEHYGHCQEGPLDLSRTPLSKKQHLLVATVTH